jgi:hypothetical protein
LLNPLPQHTPSPSKFPIRGGKQVDIAPLRALVIVRQMQAADYSRMGIVRNRSSVPDLFSPSSGRERSLPSPVAPTSTAITDAAETPLSSRLVLPKDLDTAIRQLNRQELERLLSAALEERIRRKEDSMSDENPRKGRNKAVAAPLPQGKLNAVRAAFKAGVTPSRIARQFGISQSDVRKALASDNAKR